MKFFINFLKVVSFLKGNLIVFGIIKEVLQICSKAGENIK